MKFLVLVMSSLLSCSVSAKSIFETSNVSFTLRLPYQELLDQNDEEYKIASVDTPLKDLPGKVKRRSGNKDQYCKFPHLQLKTDRSLAKNTLFEGVRAVKVKTHCDVKSNANLPTSNYGTEKELVLEYFARQAYRVLAPFAFRTAIAKIQYESFDGRYRETKTALLYENIKDLKLRHKLREISEADEPYGDDQLTMKYFSSLLSKFDQQSLANFYLFQTFILNESWQLSGLKESTTFAKNALVVESESGKWYPLAYDFNRSQLVGEDLTDIYYLSLQRLMLDEKPIGIGTQAWEQAEQNFRAKAPQLKSLVMELEGVDQDRLIRIIDGFLNLI